MVNVNFEDLLGTGAHFGHITRKWHPNFKPFILMEKNGVHIINLEETIKHLENAISFTADVLNRNGEILFVGTKKQAKDIVQQEADRCGMFYVVERWLGGTLTNFSTIRKSIKRLHLLEKEGSSIYENLTKKEVQMLNRERIKLSDQHRGIKDMQRLPDVIIVVDAHFEDTAVREAKKLEIPVIAIVDTNTNPEPIDYPIPANDDSIRTIQLIISALADAIIAVKSKSDDQLEEKSEEEHESAATKQQAEEPEGSVETVAEVETTVEPESKVDDTKVSEDSTENQPEEKPNEE